MPLLFLKETMKKKLVLFSFYSLTEMYLYCALDLGVCVGSYYLASQEYDCTVCWNFAFLSFFCVCGEGDAGA